MRENLVDFGFCHSPATGQPTFFSTTVTGLHHCRVYTTDNDAGLQRRHFRTRDFGIESERIELAVKRRASDVQPPRDLGHLAAVMADGESDGLGFDIGKRARMAAFVEQCQAGFVAESALRLVEEGRSTGSSLTIKLRSRMPRPPGRTCAELGHCRRSGLTPR